MRTRSISFQEKDDVNLGLLIVLFTVSITAFMMIGKPTDSEVEACMKATNYSKERCIHEIMR